MQYNNCCYRFMRDAHCSGGGKIALSVKIKPCTDCIFFKRRNENCLQYVILLFGYNWFFPNILELIVVSLLSILLHCV